MASYEKINYSLRPAKHIERKMMLDLFRSLHVFGSVASYRYIGFGSIYFSDFYLVHKYLGITDMINIEKDQFNEKRFSFNRPFKCIEMQFGTSTDVLPTIPWDRRTIMWLDYDGTLTKDVIADLKIVTSNLAVGSMLIVSVNADPESEANSSRAVELLRRRVGEVNVPISVTDKGLRKWGTAAAYREIITNQILEAVSDRNGGRNPGNKVMYQQIMHFNYSDGSKMVTVGGIFFDEGQKNLISIDGLKENFPFARTGEDAYLIRVPGLTFREIRQLDKHLPGYSAIIKEEMNIPEEDLKQYSETYRYFPTFAETEY